MFTMDLAQSRTNCFGKLLAVAFKFQFLYFSDAVSQIYLPSGRVAPVLVWSL